MKPRPALITAAAFLTLACATVETLVSTQAATATARPAAVAPPELQTGTEAFERAFDSGGAKMLWDLTNEKGDDDLSEPGTLRYTVDLESDSLVDIATGWCARTTSILQDNLEHFTPIIEIDGRSLSKGDLQFFDWEVKPGEDPDHPDGQKCNSWEVLASDWAVGDHLVKEGWILDAAINDGDSTFSAGEYIYEYRVTVAN